MRVKAKSIGEAFAYVCEQVMQDWLTGTQDAVDESEFWYESSNVETLLEAWSEKGQDVVNILALVRAPTVSVSRSYKLRKSSEELLVLDLISKGE